MQPRKFITWNFLERWAAIDATTFTAPMFVVRVNNYRSTMSEVKRTGLQRSFVRQLASSARPIGSTRSRIPCRMHDEYLFGWI